MYALGLEINERPLKRPLLDFENLSISETFHKGLIISNLVLKFFSFLYTNHSVICIYWEVEMAINNYVCFFTNIQLWMQIIRSISGRVGAGEGI